MDVHYLIAITIPITPVNRKYLVLEMTIALCVQKTPKPLPAVQRFEANPSTALIFSPAGLAVATPTAPR